MKLQIFVLLLFTSIATKASTPKNPKFVQLDSAKQTNNPIEYGTKVGLPANKIISDGGNSIKVGMISSPEIKSIPKLPESAKSNIKIFDSPEVLRKPKRKLKTPQNSTAALKRTAGGSLPNASTPSQTKKTFVSTVKRRKAVLDKIFGKKEKNTAPLGPPYVPAKLASAPEGTFNQLNLFRIIEKYKTDDDMSDILDDGIDAQNRERGISESKNLKKG